MRTASPAGAGARDTAHQAQGDEAEPAVKARARGLSEAQVRRSDISERAHRLDWIGEPLVQ